MNFKDYLRDHILTFTIQGLIFIFIAYTLYLGHFNHDLSLMIISIYLLGWAIYSYYEYHRKKSFYNHLLNTLDSLDQKYLVDGLMLETTNKEEELFQEVLRIIDKSMNDHISTYKNTLDDYRDFIDLWIHEIKIPLSTLRLMDENGNHSMAEELDRLDNDIEQVMFYIKSGSVEKDYLIKKVSLETMVNDVIRDNRHAFITHHIQPSLSHLDYTVRSDPKWLSYIIKQVISNSLKYSPENSTIDIYATEETNAITLTIEDHGIGVSARDLPRVFEKGFTGENGRTEYQSSGLGLYLCAKLCKSLHHEITMTCHGSTKVIITFPKSSMYQVI